MLTYVLHRFREMSRGGRVVVSVCTVTCVYLLYAAVLVPRIEPRAPGRQQAEDRGSGDLPELAAVWDPLFPADAWQRQRPMFLEGERGVLLFRGYRIVGKRQIEINPCTFVLLPQNAENDEEKRRRAVILDAPDRAVLRFDSPIDLRRGSIGKLEGGQLRGEIRVRSPRGPGPDDDLLVVTRDIKIEQQVITGRDPVLFRMGSSEGVGHGLRIDLSPGDGGSNNAAVAGGSAVESISLLRDVELHMMVPSKTEPPETDDPTAPSAAQRLATGGPIHVASKGPFRFDVPASRATFEDQVRVRKPNPQGKPDFLDCARLTVEFAAAESSTTAAAGGQDRPMEETPRLEPRRMIAEGNPARAGSPAHTLEAACRRFIYDIPAGQLTMAGELPVEVRHNMGELTCRRVMIAPDEQGGLRFLTALGPGSARGRDARRGQEVRATWAGRLDFRPHEETGEYVLSLFTEEFAEDAGDGRNGPNRKAVARCTAEAVGIGSLLADQLHFFMKQRAATPSAAPSDPTMATASARFVPQRLQAVGDVEIDAPQLTGEVDTLQAWFLQTAGSARSPVVAAKPTGPQPAAGIAPANDVPQQGAALRGLSGPSSARLPTTMNPRPGIATSRGDIVPHAPTPVPPGLSRGNAAGAVAETMPARFHLEGGLVRLELQMHADETKLSQLHVSDDVRLTQTQTSKPYEKPLAVVADWIYVDQRSGAANRFVSINGRPANVDGRGLSLTGPKIQLRGSENVLWVDGPGSMRLPLPEKNGRNPQASDPLVVAWQGGMWFDGREARFDKSVEGRNAGRLMRTEVLEVSLESRLDMSEGWGEGAASGDNQPNVQTIVAPGGVYLESNQFDEAGRLSVDKLWAQEGLSLDQLSGVLESRGPGWLTSVRRGGTSVAGGKLPGQPAAPLAGQQESGLSYLAVEFAQGIKGNLAHDRQSLTFLEARAVHGPVADWNETISPDDVDRLGDRGLAMKCERLTVNQMRLPGSETPHRELVAEGNTFVEGTKFTAAGTRITYDQSKDLLVLEGDGYDDAHLTSQDRPGGFHARKIRYWPSTGAIRVEDFRSGELHFGGGNGGPKSPFFSAR